MRGGNRSDADMVAVLPGSSPLARGKPEVSGTRNPSRRIIPACAGETRYGSAHRRAHQDHPRLRGGNSGLKMNPRPSGGSSPLARGKQIQAITSNPLTGIIPACAGETEMTHGTEGPVGDHPRLRGGNSTPRLRQPLSLGSSPLARGKPSGEKNADPKGRIIPACAGETGRAVIQANIPRDHPRLRGGNSVDYPSVAFDAGSSPLARGKPRSPASPLATLTDHPRLRGGN